MECDDEPLEVESVNNEEFRCSFSLNDGVEGGWTNASREVPNRCETEVLSWMKGRRHRCNVSVIVDGIVAGNAVDDSGMFSSATIPRRLSPGP